MKLQRLDFLRAGPAGRAASRLAQRLGIASRPLDVQQMIEIAMERTRRRDLGPLNGADDVYDNLHRLLAALDHGATLSSAGRSLLNQFIVDTLCNRLEIVAWDRQHPNVFRSPVQAPVFIIGLPFSGMEHLHELLAQDTANRVPAAWEVAHSVPPASAYSFARDPRIDATEQTLARLKRQLPGSVRTQLAQARAAQDCSVILAAAGASEAFTMALHAPAYRSWIKASDLTSAYGWHRQALQHMQSAYMAARWLLRSAQHLGHLPALTATYPDARFIFVHRQPEQALAEHLDFCQQLRRAAHVRAHADIDAQEEIVHWAYATEQAMTFIRAQPSLPVAHVRHTDLMRRPLQTIEEIYEKLDIGLAPMDKRRIEEHIGRVSAHQATLRTQQTARPISTQLQQQIAVAFARYNDALAKPLP